MPETTMVQAIGLALGRAMSEDERVIILGEDVGLNGGVFRTNRRTLCSLWPRPCT